MELKMNGIVEVVTDQHSVPDPDNEEKLIPNSDSPPDESKEKNPRSREPKRGIWIPLKIWKYKHLSVQERIVVSIIAGFKGRWGCFASNSYFAQRLHIEDATVRNLLSRLRKKGVVHNVDDTQQTAMQRYKQFKRILALTPEFISEIDFDNRDKQGIWIPEEVWCCTSLTTQERILVSVIHGFNTNGDGCHANNSYFAEMLGVEKDTIKVTISNLRSRGIICNVDHNFWTPEQKKKRKRILSLGTDFDTHVFGEECNKNHNQIVRDSVTLCTSNTPAMENKIAENAPKSVTHTPRFVPRRKAIVYRGKPHPQAFRIINVFMYLILTNTGGIGKVIISFINVLHNLLWLLNKTKDKVIISFIKVLNDLMWLLDKTINNNLNLISDTYEYQSKLVLAAVTTYNPVRIPDSIMVDFTKQAGTPVDRKPVAPKPSKGKTPLARNKPLSKGVNTYRKYDWATASKEEQKLIDKHYLTVDKILSYLNDSQMPLTPLSSFTLKQTLKVVSLIKIYGEAEVWRMLERAVAFMRSPEAPVFREIEPDVAFVVYSLASLANDGDRVTRLSKHQPVFDVLKQWITDMDVFVEVGDFSPNHKALMAKTIESKGLERFMTFFGFVGVWIYAHKLFAADFQRDPDNLASDEKRMAKQYEKFFKHCDVGYIVENLDKLGRKAFKTQGVVVDKDKRDLLHPKEKYFARRWREDFYDPTPGRAEVYSEKSTKKSCYKLIEGDVCMKKEFNPNGIPAELKEAKQSVLWVGDLDENPATGY